jgi:polyribonucleotide nucleotidyltransferase
VLAQQADGAVTVRLGDTIVFSAVTATKKPREGIDFFPLQVEYREKYYAAGRFPGGYFKREATALRARNPDRPRDRPPPAPVLPRTATATTCRSTTC